MRPERPAPKKRGPKTALSDAELADVIRGWLREPEVQERRYVWSAASTKLAPFAEGLRQALAADAHRPRSDRRTAGALFESIREQGYAGGYSQVTAFVQA